MKVISALSWTPLLSTATRELFSIETEDGKRLLSAPGNNSFRYGDPTKMREINISERDILVKAECGIPYSREEDIPSVNDLQIASKKMLGWEVPLESLESVHESLYHTLDVYVDAANLPVGEYLVSKS